MGTAVTHVEVERGDDGRLVVRWRLTEPGPVELAVGAAADAIDRTRVLAVVDGAEARLDPPGPGRPYVAVTPAGGGASIIAAERRLPLEGALNFRDLGGYPTADGGRVRWGRVFRSDALHALTPGDVEVVRGLGIRTVYDLREDAEREEAPSTAIGDAVRLEIASLTQRRASRELLDRISRGEIEAVDDELMADGYLALLERGASVVGRVVAGLADDHHLPALFHCTAGKDRTGLVAVLLLSTLGVGDEDVLDDYELTSRYWTSHRRQLAGIAATSSAAPTLFEELERRGIDVAALAPLFGANRGTAAAVLERLRERHGGATGYLVDVAGVAPEVIDRLRGSLVVRG